MNNSKIAIIGMACRAPGAENVEQFWSNLVQGVESIKRDASRVSVEDEKRYVHASTVFPGTEFFDNDFFGYTPKEAEYMDPQQRIFLETAWSALEHAGYRPSSHEETIGIFAGCSINKYFIYNLYSRLMSNGELGGVSGDEVPLGTTPDYLTSRVAYKLGLKGPAVSVQATCASSLVSICMAGQSLADYRCDIALAGGISVKLTDQTGYWAQKDGLFSPSGKCRPYDSSADGSVFSSGAGIVVLKRLEDALQDNDQIYAVIRGWATNNDGSDRLGFTTPGLNGQAAVVVEAQLAANVKPEELTYIEGHGSATPIGDQIEVASLKKAFQRSKVSRTGFCALGSVKGNIGHTDAASGVLGLIKTALSLKHKVFPPSLNFERAHPDMNMEKSPFFVNSQSYDVTGKSIVLAGVSSFGLGGTNAHLIVENPPLQMPAPPKSFVLLPFSARTSNALAELETGLIQQMNQTDPLDDVAYTLAVGREEFPERKALIVQNSVMEGQRKYSVMPSSFHQNFMNQSKGKDHPPKITFMFTGLGDLYSNVGAELYREEPVFRSVVDECAKKLKPVLHIDLRDHLYPVQTKEPVDQVKQEYGLIDFRRMVGRSPQNENNELLTDTLIAQPSCFVFEYALAKLLMSWGIAPDQLIGHSLGEYVAACIGNVLSIDDALMLVAKRAQLISTTPKGEMLAVPIPEERVQPYLSDHVSLSAVNTDNLCLLSGKQADIQAVKDEMYNREEIVGKLLPTTHAFHSVCLLPIQQELENFVQGLSLHKPVVPFVSNVTGKWISEEICSPRYWGQHLTQPVRFADGIKLLLAEREPQILIEIGPGNTLTSFCNTIINTSNNSNISCTQTIPAYYDTKSSLQSVLELVGTLWSMGVVIDWPAMHSNSGRRRTAAPTYPFAKKRFWMERIQSKDILELKSSSFKLSEPMSASEIQAKEEKISLINSSSGTPRPDIGIPFEPPTSSLEQKLSTIWAELFGYEAIGIHDDFFILGGHSLLALQLSNKIYQLLQIELHLVTLLEHPTIAQLSAVIRDQPGYKEAAFTAEKINITHSTEDINAPVSTNHSGISELLKLTIQTSLKREVVWEEILSEEDLLKLIPELMLALKRKYDLPFYPNELTGEYSPSSLSNYLLKELDDYNSTVQMLKKKSAQWVPQIDLSERRQVVFVLSSVRSGSTLLRVMLAGHGQLFSPPELHLLGHTDMRERAAAQLSSDRDQGLLVTLKELQGCTTEEAEQLVSLMTKENWPTMKVLSYLMDMSDPKLLVDKSPGYSNQIRTLERIHHQFTNAKFIYLVRHPYSVIESVVRNRFVRLMGGGQTDPYDYGEFLWTRSNSNIMDFLEHKDKQSYCTIRYEDLMREPRTYLEQMCGVIDIPFTEELLRPYQGRKMRDGLGDPNFTSHHEIDYKMGDVWRDITLPRPLGRSTRKLAKELGYMLP
ncbi:acyltransferase domain-containing protein [Paenibacillus polysaccharolyticus]|uniref:type I polyketide synthase n=1 Tax=Paenibacillus polysaccharolyticus TaxID=582692 RepID=UPI00204063AB|nr:type I polyketide synthase [Paenibacillus polysaccharolyticus]MCM3132897.1 acyltransferase domain-containing protein [Paenibacillus polysaccharolyticus]